MNLLPPPCLVTGRNAGNRADNTRRANNRQNINDRVQNDGRDGNALITNLDANITIALDPATPGGEKRTHAVTAQALRSLGDTELQNVIDTNIATLMTGQIFATAPANITGSLANINGTGTGPANGDDYRRVIGFLRTRAESSPTRRYSKWLIK